MWHANGYPPDNIATLIVYLSDIKIKLEYTPSFTRSETMKVIQFLDLHYEPLQALLHDYIDIMIN